jgi:hypothetical protein
MSNGYDYDWKSYEEDLEHACTLTRRYRAHFYQNHDDAERSARAMNKTAHDIQRLGYKIVIRFANTDHTKITKKSI